MPPFDTFLAPLQKLTTRNPDVEAHVLWFTDGAWSDAAGEVLDAEEIAFYAEGLLMEGFGAAWQHLQSAQGDAHVRLLFWQSGAPDFPASPMGWTVVADGVFHP